MTPSRISLTLGLIGAILIGGVLWTAGRQGSVLFQPGWVEVLVVAVTAGLVQGAAHRVMTHRLNHDLRKLEQQVRDAADGSAVLRAESPAWLASLAQAIRLAADHWRRRVDDLLSQRRAQEVQLKLIDMQRRHAESILNTIEDAVIVTDAFNEVALANEAAARALDFDLGGALRKPVDHVISDTTLAHLIKDTRQAGLSPRRRHVEHRVRKEGGESAFDVSLSCVGHGPWATGGGEAAGVVTVLRDVTREREIVEAKSEFVTAVSHELRTPLASIKAYMEMLVDGEAQDEQARAEFYHVIQDEANRLERLIDHMMTISHIESGVAQVRREPTTLGDLLRQVMDLMRPRAAAHGVTMDGPDAPQQAIEVCVDAAMIRQAVTHLLDNAIRYTPDGGQVSVAMGLDATGQWVDVTVADTGIGIPQSDLAHLFGKFHRVSQHKKIAKGTGLGLNLVKHLVETVHGGKVSADSKPGHGSTFRLRLPVAAQAS